jgi:hypothetical protein
MRGGVELISLMSCTTSLMSRVKLLCSHQPQPCYLYLTSLPFIRSPYLFLPAGVNHAAIFDSS